MVPDVVSLNLQSEGLATMTNLLDHLEYAQSSPALTYKLMISDSEVDCANSTEVVDLAMSSGVAFLHLKGCVGQAKFEKLVRYCELL